MFESPGTLCAGYGADFKTVCYDSVSQTVCTVRCFGEFTKALKNFASTPFRIYVSRERERERLFFLKEIWSLVTHC